ncbi:MAG: type II toxin-antitoxin system VapC family toxin [Streptosporangiales bacterium]
MIVVDTGPLVAAAIANDRDHDRCVDLFGRVRGERMRLIVPAFVAGETCYMLERDGGSAAEASFLASLSAGRTFVLEALLPEDLHRMATLVDKYADLRLGAADASVVAVAERLGVTKVATLNLRDFRVVRPRHVSTFTLLPE